MSSNFVSKQQFIEGISTDGKQKLNLQATVLPLMLTSRPGKIEHNLFWLGKPVISE